MLSKNEVSLADVAREAGVSATTVSRVLNKKPGDIRISEETRQRVLEAVERLGYKRNALAHALRSSKSGIVAAINRSVSGSRGSTFAHEIQRAAHELDVEILMGMMRLNEDGITAQINVLQEQLFDGFLILGEVPAYENLLPRLLSLGKPIVGVGTNSSHDAFPTVNVDNRAGAKLALAHLLELGHRRIGFLGSTSTYGVKARYETYVRFLADQGLALQPEYVSHMDNLVYQPEKLSYMEELHYIGIQSAQRLLQLPDPPTAIFCGADGFAIAAIKGALRLGIAVPGQVSIIGFDDSREAFQYEPELTTIRQPVRAIAQAAIRILLQLIDDPEDVSLRQNVEIPPQLIIRGSTTTR